jgi:heterotetrameric sarcosine oxidase delta subunit
MLIQCPNCGARDVSEFTYLGDATVKRPTSDTASRQDWQDFVYSRKNPRGPHLELWQHSGGCRLVFEVKRDTLTHEIHETRVAGSDKTRSTKSGSAKSGSGK